MLKKISDKITFIIDVAKFSSLFYVIGLIILNFLPKVYNVQLDKSEIVPLEEHNSKILYSSAIVVIQSKLGTCSGAIIDNNYVLTAAHCVVDDNKLMSGTTFTINEFLPMVTNKIEGRSEEPHV